MDEGKDVKVCNLEFSKTFYPVSHQLLISKMKDFGVFVGDHRRVEDFLGDMVFSADVGNNKYVQQE